MVWRKDIYKLDLDHHVFGVSSTHMSHAHMRKVLAKSTDVSRFGKGGAKTVDQLESELATGMSRLVEGADGKVRRLVNTVALRLYSSPGPDKMMLVETAEVFPDGRERKKMHLPVTKLGPNETLQMCVNNWLLPKIGMTAIKMRLDFKNPIVEETTLESPSYPGVLTVYHTSTITGYVTDMDTNALMDVGLPQCTTYETACDINNMTYFMTWMKEDEAEEILCPHSHDPDHHEPQAQKDRYAIDPSRKI